MPRKDSSGHDSSGHDSSGHDSPRRDSPRKPAGPAPKDERRETEERLAEAIGGHERRKARDAMKEDPSLPHPDAADRKKAGTTDRTGGRQ